MLFVPSYWDLLKVREKAGVITFYNPSLNSRKMKIILIAFFSAFISHQVLAQKTTIVENAQKSQYENTSYLVVGSLTLKPGFNFNSAQQGTFFARAYNNDPSAAPTEWRCNLK